MKSVKITLTRDAEVVLNGVRLKLRGGDDLTLTDPNPYVTYDVVFEIKEPREQAPEVRPAADEHDAERAQALGENYRSARDLRAALGPGWHLDHRCPFCLYVDDLIGNLAHHISHVHFGSQPPVPGQVAVPRSSWPKPWPCPRCGRLFSFIEDTVAHLNAEHPGTAEPPC